MFFFFLFQRQQLQSTGPVGAEKRPATGGRARDANLHAYIRIGRGRKREHVHSDSQEQVHAHGHQLLPVQSSRVGPAVARVRIAAGDLPNMVQVYIHAEPSIFIFFTRIQSIILDGFMRLLIDKREREKKNPRL